MMPLEDMALPLETVRDGGLSGWNIESSPATTRRLPMCKGEILTLLLLIFPLFRRAGLPSSGWS